MTEWVIGDHHGLPIPADPAALRDGGPEYLTEAFRAAGALRPGVAVASVLRCEDVRGGSTGRKALLDIGYSGAQSDSPTDLFVKFSRDFDDPGRDRGRTQMEPEITFALLAQTPGFPIAVPRTVFADYHRDSGTGVLITERIAFGRKGIEQQYHKCLDYAMPRPTEHYRALVSALGRLAGAHLAGRLDPQFSQRFPVDLRAATVGEPAPLTEERLSRRLDRLAEFAVSHRGLVPANIRSADFLERLRIEAPQVLRREAGVWQHLAGSHEHIALCHWNANVDNAWFWSEDGELRCGLMDWGCVSQMNIAMALWGALSGAETELWDEHFDELLDVFCAAVHHAGGPPLNPSALEQQLLLYATLMGITWLLDVPALLRIKVPGSGPETHRADQAIRDDEGVRAPLQMLINVLNLWESRDLAGALATLPTR